MRRLVLLTFLCLIAFCAIAPNHVLAADGDVSGDSITSISETLADDVLHYPDVFHNDTITYASDEIYDVGDSDTNDHTDTFAVGGDAWQVNSFENGANDFEVQMWLEFLIPDGINIEGFSYAMYAKHDVVAIAALRTMIWNTTSSAWVKTNIGATTSYTWFNDTVYNPDYWNSTSISIGINVYQGFADFEAYIDYAEITYYTMTNAASGFADSFADISDCGSSNGVDISTDSDVVRAEQAGDDTYRYLFANGISMPSAEGLYLEVRVWGNGTAGSIKFYTGDADNGGSLSLLSGTPSYTPTARTHKFPINHNNTVECIAFRFKDSEPTSLYSDYVRVDDSINFGWQHDGSTTEGVTTGAGGSFSSDGDAVNCSSSVAGREFSFWFDTTATNALSEGDYYQFLEVSISQVYDGDGDNLVWRPRITDGSTYEYLADKQGNAGVYRYNVKASTVPDIQRVYIYIDDDLDWFTVDYMKLYSIANFTVTQSSVGVDEFLYVESGSLKSTKDSVAYFQLDYDPSLSVSDTFPVWNLTLSDVSADFPAADDYGLRQYVGGWGSWVFDTSRGPTDSGTITDIRVIIYVSLTLSAIKFIEDSTAPSVIRANLAPIDPYDDESVTLSAVVTDTVEVYEVYFDAITYPSGFSDTAYYATEQSDNLWTYSFNTLINGYYCFKVVATDGANTNSLDYYSYVDFTVRERDLDAEGNFYTAGSQVQLSGEINMDATYTVYEDDVQISTGSVSEGSISITWTRATTTEAADVDVGIKFVNGSLTDWVNGTYSKSLQTNFAVEEWDIDLHLGEHSYVDFEVRTTWGNATVNAYDNNTLMKSVSESVGGIISWFWLEGAGLHQIVLNITAGGTTFTRTRPIDVPDWGSGALVVRWDLTTFQDNYTLLELESTWKNCTYSIYMNSSLVATSANDPVTLNISRTIDIGEYNLTIHADGGSQTYTISNIRYVITEEGITYDYSNMTHNHHGGGQSTYYGDNIINQEAPPGIYLSTDAMIILLLSIFTVTYLVFIIASKGEYIVRFLKHWRS